MSQTSQYPCSPRTEIDGVVYFPRLCDKIRLNTAGKLGEEYLGNLGNGMDLWTCQYLGVNYADLADLVEGGATDSEALAWARNHGLDRPAHEFAWWSAYMKTRGFRDDLAAKLEQRKAESGFQDRADIQSFMDYIDADEGRI